jgi:hypothetical protein
MPQYSPCDISGDVALRKSFLVSGVCNVSLYLSSSYNHFVDWHVMTQSVAGISQSPVSLSNSKHQCLT